MKVIKFIMILVVCFLIGQGVVWVFSEKPPKELVQPKDQVVSFPKCKGTSIEHRHSRPLPFLPVTWYDLDEIKLDPDAIKLIMKVKAEDELPEAFKTKVYTGKYIIATIEETEDICKKVAEMRLKKREWERWGKKK